MSVVLWLFHAERCSNGTIRLAGSGYATMGRVELCINGEWGTICINSFDDNDATVVCRQLGYSTYGKSIYCTVKIIKCFEGVVSDISNWDFYDSSVPIIIFDLNCTGTEDMILSCPYIERGSYTCSSYYDAAVICQSMYKTCHIMIKHALAECCVKDYSVKIIFTRVHILTMFISTKISSCLLYLVATNTLFL